MPRSKARPDFRRDIKTFCYTSRGFAIQEVFMFRLGPAELVIILLIVIFLFGGKRIPEIGKGIGDGLRNLKKSLKSDDSAEKTKSA